jgi:hypothetical protein
MAIDHFNLELLTIIRLLAQLFEGDCSRLLLLASGTHNLRTSKVVNPHLTLLLRFAWLLQLVNVDTFGIDCFQVHASVWNLQ